MLLETARRVNGRSCTGVRLCDEVELKEKRHSILHFLTSVCALVGGLFTVSGIVDATVYHGHKAIKKKIDLGKMG